MRIRLIAFGVAGVVVLVLLAGAFFLGDTHAVQTMSVHRASPTELAEAMKHDSFFSSYRESTLVVQGTVVSFDPTIGAARVSLQASSTFAVICDVGTQAMTLHVGDEVTVLAEGARAERQSSGVLLRGCTIV